MPLGKRHGVDVNTVVGCKLDKRVELLGLADGNALAWWQLKGQGVGGHGNGVAPCTACAHGSDAVSCGVEVGGNGDDELFW